MRRLLLWAVPLLLLAPVLAYDDSKDKPQGTPAEQVQALQKEFAAARDAYVKAATAAKTPEDRKKAVELIPRPQNFVPKFMEIAEKNPKDPAAVDALIWIVQNASGLPEGTKAIDLLAEKAETHAGKMGPLAPYLSRSQNPKAEKILTVIAEKADNPQAKGQALMALANLAKTQADNIRHLREGNRQGQFIERSLGKEAAEALKAKDPDQVLKKAEKLFEEVASKYGDVKEPRGTLADAAKAELFEIRFLSIGRNAPEIEAEDTDGVKFKLSDYRGKVVMLDFWGHW